MEVQKVTLLYPPGISDSKSSLQIAIKPAMVTAQFFAILPVDGVTSRNVHDLKFRWISIKTLYCYVKLVGALVLLTFTLIINFRHGFNFYSINDIVWQLRGVLGSMAFLNIAKNWPKLAKQWAEMELEMKAYRDEPNIKLRFYLMGGIMATVGLIANVFKFDIYAPENDGKQLEVYFLKAFPHSFAIMEYGLGKALFVQFMSTTTTFAWHFSDIFIMFLSVALASRFRQLSKRMNTPKVENIHESFWRIIRKDYNRLVLLCEAVNTTIAYLVLLSFSSGLTFVTVQIFMCFKDRHGFVEKIYYIFQLVALISRLYCLCLFTADVNNESTGPVGVLMSVPTKHYNVEIDRFVDQMSISYISITGWNYFSVTKGFLLSFIGVVVTLELVLIQFGADLLDED